MAARTLPSRATRSSAPGHRRSLSASNVAASASGATARLSSSSTSSASASTRSTTSTAAPTTTTAAAAKTAATTAAATTTRVASTTTTSTSSTTKKPKAVVKRRNSLSAGALVNKHARVLTGVIAMVDVRVGPDGQIDCSDVVAEKMAELGAVIVKRFTPRVTHIVLSQLTPTWKDKIAKWESHISVGLARRVDGRPEVQIVSQLWVNACYVSKSRMAEAPFFPVAKTASSDGHLHLNGAMRQFVLKHPPPAPAAVAGQAAGTPTPSVTDSSSATTATTSASASASASAALSTSTPRATGASSSATAVLSRPAGAAAVNRRKTLDAPSVSTTSSAKATSTGPSPPTSRHAAIQFQFGAAAALAAATLGSKAMMKRKRRALSMEPMASDAIEKLLTGATPRKLSDQAPATPQSATSVNALDKTLDLDALETPEPVETPAKRRPLSSAKRRKTMSEVPSATLSMPLVLPAVDPNPQKKLFQDVSTDCVAESPSDNDDSDCANDAEKTTRRRPLRAPAAPSSASKDAASSSAPLETNARARAITIDLTDPSDPIHATSTATDDRVAVDAPAKDATAAASSSASAKTVVAAAADPTTAPDAFSLGVADDPRARPMRTTRAALRRKPQTPPTPVHRRVRASVSSPRATTGTTAFTTRILTTPKTITKASGAAAKRQRVGSTKPTTSAARMLPLAPPKTPSRPPAPTGTAAAAASVAATPRTQQRTPHAVRGVSVLEMTPVRVTERVGAKRALATSSSSSDAVATPSRRPSDARVRTEQLERLTTPQRASSSRVSAQASTGALTTPAKTPRERPLGAVTPRSVRSVIGITGVDLETRGVIECAVHAIDASMVAEPGYRKARVVKSVDYAAAVTHLIVGGEDTKRTIKVLFAIARGAWIVSEAWVFASLEREQWLPEADYELSMYANRVARENPSTRLIFKGMKFFVGSNVEPSREVLQSLLQCAGGEICNQISVADVCICSDGSLSRRAQRTGVRVVTAKWVFDSIGAMKLADETQYGVTSATATSLLDDTDE